MRPPLLGGWGEAAQESQAPRTFRGRAVWLSSPFTTVCPPSPRGRPPRWLVPAPTRPALWVSAGTPGHTFWASGQQARGAQPVSARSSHPPPSPRHPSFLRGTGTGVWGPVGDLCPLRDCGWGRRGALRPAGRRVSGCDGPFRPQAAGEGRGEAHREGAQGEMKTKPRNQRVPAALAGRPPTPAPARVPSRGRADRGQPRPDPPPDPAVKQNLVTCVLLPFFLPTPRPLVSGGTPLSPPRTSAWLWAWLLGALRGNPSRGRGRGAGWPRQILEEESLPPVWLSEPPINVRCPPAGVSRRVWCPRRPRPPSALQHPPSGLLRGRHHPPGQLVAVGWPLGTVPRTRPPLALSPQAPPSPQSPVGPSVEVALAGWGALATTPPGRPRQRPRPPWESRAQRPPWVGKTGSTSPPGMVRADPTRPRRDLGFALQGPAQERPRGTSGLCFQMCRLGGWGGLDCGMVGPGALPEQGTQMGGGRGAALLG